MPTIPDIPGPYRFFFYSFDCHEPMHVHVERDSDTCKFWLDPVALATNHGFSARIRQLIKKHSDRMTNAWREHCNPT